MTNVTRHDAFNMNRDMTSVTRHDACNMNTYLPWPCGCSCSCHFPTPQDSVQPGAPPSVFLVVDLIQSERIRSFYSQLFGIQATSLLIFRMCFILDWCFLATSSQYFRIHFRMDNNKATSPD